LSINIPIADRILLLTFQENVLENGTELKVTTAYEFFCQVNKDNDADIHGINLTVVAHQLKLVRAGGQNHINKPKQQI
jgi:hypothetical protein